MNQITFPLKPEMTGPEVGDLQAALLLLLEQCLILPGDENARRELSGMLQPELLQLSYGRATRKLVGIFQEERHLAVHGSVDEATASELNRTLDELNGHRNGDFAVRGTLRRFDGVAVASVAMVAFDRDLRSEQLLGQAKTNRSGSYQIRYSARQFAKLEKDSADLVVKAFAADGSLLAASPTLFNAPCEAEVDLTIAAENLQPATLFDRIYHELAPLLEGVRPEQLEEDREHQDVTFLSGETGLTKEALARFILAHRLALRGIQAEFWFVLLGGSLYRFAEHRSLAEQLEELWQLLPSLDAGAVRKALVRGFNEDEIPDALKRSAEQWVEAFLRLTAGRLLEDAAAGPSFVKQALQEARIADPQRQERFARLFNEAKALTPELLAALEKDGSFREEEIADLTCSFQLSGITRGDFSVVKTIKDHFEVRRPEQVRALAKRSGGEWVHLVQKSEAAGTLKLPFEMRDVAGQAQLPQAELYGRMLSRQFREAFPTAAFSGDLERALNGGEVAGVPQPEALGRLLARYDDFELLSTPVDRFLDDNPDPEIGDLARDQQFRLGLKAVQRVFKLAPSFEATDALLADDLHAAQTIYRMGETTFVRRYGERPGFTRESARLAWNRAADTHAAVLTIVADLKALQADALPLALGENSDALESFPNWNNLFQSGELCDCEHCRSVLGPAAYFTDLLMFLRDRKTKNPAATVKDLLFGRRPDLGYLELSCANALTPLPYLDLVCEVLEEAAAAGENDLELAGFAAMPADADAAKQAVAAALEPHGIALGAQFSLSQVNPSDPERWVVHGEQTSYLLKKKAPDPDFFAQILPNTKASAAELRAYPQYLNPGAYRKLRAAKHPLSLPFDLFAEEVRTSFRKGNLQRWELMGTLRCAAPPNRASAGEIAAEYFGISADPGAPFDEKRLILVSETSDAGQQELWGESGGDWLDAVGKVANFLRKGSLEYNDLLALLDLKFINPDGDIAVQHLDPSCDTDRKVIGVLDAAKLDRMHRFLRLWRKLKGWQPWELDLVLCHPRIGNGSLDETFLVKLFHLSRLRGRLGSKTSLEQVCALFGDLNTQTRFAGVHEKRQDGLYARLFLDRRLINPLDPAFIPDPASGDLPAGETLSGHLPVLSAALGVGEAELRLFLGLAKASDGTPYLSDALTLANLSFLWRQVWLSKLLKLKAKEWPTLLKILQQDLPEFTGPQAALEFLESADRVKASGFSVDALNWLLSADRSAQSALKEADVARFLSALRKELQAIRDEFDPARFDFLNEVPPRDPEALATLLGSLLQRLGRSEAEALFFLACLKNEVSLEKKVAGLPAGFDFPAPVKNALRISYDEPSTLLRFTGVMTVSEITILLTDPSLATVSGIASYQEAVEELFSAPRLALKFYQPLFSAPLAALPAALDFRTLSDAALARRIFYDAEARQLRLSGILRRDEKESLDALSADPGYRNAVNSLALQPVLIAPPDPRIWLLESDLQFPLADNLALNLAKAATGALAYLSQTLSQVALVQRASVGLGLPEALTRRVLGFALLPGTLLDHFLGPFAASTGVVDYATLKTGFDAWYWANRVGAILKKWKLTLPELERIVELAPPAQLLDFPTLPLDDGAPAASLERLLRTHRLARLRDTLPEPEVTLLEVLENLVTAGYASTADFAADLERLNPEWPAADAAILVDALELVYPVDYLLAESWERLRRAFQLMNSLNAGAAQALSLAAPAMGAPHARTVKELLRSKLGTETFLTLSGEIQDQLREQKRDALVAYLLTLPMPAQAPSGKWENGNDLYAHYLLDVEMSSCLSTSRLVQASGSVQLLVQRCFMGLEPEVEVRADGADGDSAWRWWKWMSKYRVWEANRKVFLWPENWIEPELKKDRSPFFKDLENELLQNEVNRFSVETAFAGYLEKLDGVAQLEIAGFFQEDDGDHAILHVFGRSKGVEPHLYYYRRYDYRAWTPWEKIDLEIQGDYLIPAVVNKRLFLFWPVFTEVADESGNSTVKVPKLPGNSESSFTPDRAKKKLRLQLALSDYRQGKWTPKRVSKDFAESSPYDREIVKKHYRFFPIDRSAVDGRFGIKFEGYSTAGSPGSPIPAASLFGAFEIAGCKGVPELSRLPGYFTHAVRPEREATGNDTAFLKWVELGPFPARLDAPQNDFTLENRFASGDALRFTTLLEQTPWIFKVAPPWHLSHLDKLWMNGLAGIGRGDDDAFPVPAGSWLPFFYQDQGRSFLALPSLSFPREDRPAESGTSRLYYPEIKRIFRQWEDYFAGQIQTWLDGFDLSTLTPVQRQALEQALAQAFPEEPLPPYSDRQVKALMQRWFTRYVHLFLGGASLRLFQFRQFHFKNHYHPFVCDFAKTVHNPLQGIPKLMSRETQLKDSGFEFRRSYQPTPWVVEPGSEQFYPRESVDFAPDGAYACYNWELFFHAPLLIANTLSRNQRFEEAREWYHFIFNPIGVESTLPGGSVMSKYWITKPFFQTGDPQYLQQRIDRILLLLAGDTSVPGYSVQAKKELEDQVLDWRNHPFEPHRIANYRTVAYQKTVVMKYLDNLVAWGDNLFRQDSMESINEATQLYVLAAEILGPRPGRIPPRARPPLQSFNELETELDSFANALVEVENLVPVLPGTGGDAEDQAPLPMLYFCIPQNEKLLGYWDTVADRLFKIRHCMNIEGVVRALALFEPPIDPGALVKAAAGGTDLSSALAELNAPLPLYRFAVLLQKANEVCSDVRALGGALLAALEKKDAEALSLLRQGQELRTLEAVKAVREKQIEEAKENLTGLQRARATVEERRNYYRDIKKMIDPEQLHLDKLGASHTYQEIAQGIKLGASIVSILPAIDLGGSGFGGSPVAKFKIGGLELGQAASLSADVLSFLALIASNDSVMASSKAGFERRFDEWKLQERLADRELLQLESSIASATIRIELAAKELENHLLQTEDARETDSFLRSKYTGEELYQWQVGQISGVYFQSYRLAYDLAKRAERCFRFELGLSETSYVSFGYWDSLKKGLLSGEKLQYDLRRLESAYLEQNRREFELTKHISLALLDPLALLQLRETGRCFLTLPEEIFDLDFPGHYFRRVKSVSLSLPCVVGPYSTISCTLRLLKNSFRINTASGDNGYPHNSDDQGVPVDDNRFAENNIAVKAVAFSGADRDSGMFEMSFRDERYLPFEGAGAVSAWSLELFNDPPANNPDPAQPDFGKALRQFDYATITDAVLHLSYTAREDAGAFKDSAVSHLRDYLTRDGAIPSLRLFNLRQEFPSEWSRFLKPTNAAQGNLFELELAPGLFRFLDLGKTLKVNSIRLLARCTDAGSYQVVMAPPLPAPPPAGSDTLTLAPVAQYGGLHFGERDVSALGIVVDPAAAPVRWRLKMTRPGGGDLQEDPVKKVMEVEELYLLLGYEWE